jgi:hypothetical protein
VRKLKVRLTFMLSSCLLLLCSFPLVEAGSFSIPPATIYGTTITVSASYPDFHFDEPTNISLTITVNFYNESVSAVNITAIHVRLYYSSVNITEAVAYQPPTHQSTYASTDWLSTDYYPEWWNKSSIPTPLKIERTSPQISTGSANLQLTLSYSEYYGEKNQEVQAKLFVQVTLCFLDINGEAIWRTADLQHFWEVGYHWTIFSGEGEAPYVTIYPKTAQQFWLFRPEILGILVGSIGLVLVGIAVAYMRRKRHKLRGTQG